MAVERFDPDFLKRGVASGEIDTTALCEEAAARLLPELPDAVLGFTGRPVTDADLAIDALKLARWEDVN